jgi:hypothetical protein
MEYWSVGVMEKALQSLSTVQDHLRIKNTEHLIDLSKTLQIHQPDSDPILRHSNTPLLHDSDKPSTAKPFISILPQ